jgi:predicted small secreted protein
MSVRKKVKARGIVLYGIVLGVVLALTGCNTMQSVIKDGNLCQLPGHCARSSPLGSSYGNE